MTQNTLMQMPFSIVSPNTNFVCSNGTSTISFYSPEVPSDWYYLGFAGCQASIVNSNNVQYGTITLVQAVDGYEGAPPIVAPAAASSQNAIFSNNAMSITQVTPPFGYVSIGLAANSNSGNITLACYMCVRADLCVVVPPSSLTLLGSDTQATPATSVGPQTITFWQLPYSGYVVASVNFNTPLPNNAPAYPPSPIYDLNPNT